MRWRTGRPWAPVAAAAAVLVVSAAALLVGGADDGPDRVALPPAASEASASPTPTAQPSAEPAPAGSAEPADEAPAGPGLQPAPRPSGRPEPTSEPDAPASTAPGPSSPAPRRPSAAPSPPAPSPGAARADFAFDAAYGTDEPREVVVQYGDSSSCPHERVTHAVTESADRVVVTLTADAQDPGRACTADYRQRLVPVRLQEPLGDRVLVDGSRGEQVPVDRSCSRPFAQPPPPRDCRP